MLLKSIYRVQVVAMDLEDRTAYSEVTTLKVDRNLKIGNFTISFNDLSVPVAGIPIETVRTYDSRDEGTTLCAQLRDSGSFSSGLERCHRTKICLPDETHSLQFSLRSSRSASCFLAENHFLSIPI